MKRSHFKIFFALCLAATFFAGGADAATWDEALSAAAQNNDQILSARKAADSSEWSYNKAWTAFLPQVNASGSYSETLVGSATAVSKNYSYGLNASQSLFKGFQNYYGLKSAYANMEQARASLKKTESDVYHNVRLAFIDLYIAQKNIEISTSILNRLMENARLIKLRYDSGREDKGNLLYTSASEAQGEYNLGSAKRDLLLARLKLSQLTSTEIIGVDGDPLITLEAVGDPAALVEKAPDYIIAKYQLELADIADQNTVGEFLPNASLSGNWGKSGSTWPPERESKSWSLNLSLPIFPGGSSIADKIINSINLDKARSDFQATRKSKLFEVAQAYQNALGAIDSLRVSMVFLDASSERAKIADEKYLNGLMTYNDWDTIIRNYISSQNQVLSNKKSALAAIAALKNSYGGY